MAIFPDGVYFFDASHNSYAIFNLDYEYTSFLCTITASNETGSDASFNVSFYLNEKRIEVEIEGFTKRTIPQKITFDVVGVKTLEIRTSNTGVYNNGFIAVVDAFLAP